MFTDEEHKFKAYEYMFKDFECIFTAHKQKIYRINIKNDLKRLVADADSGITTRGSHSHKVWVAMK